MLLSKATLKKCQDRRDRIFALNAVFRALSMRATANVPNPDYRKSYHEADTEVQDWISQIEGEGVVGIETLEIASPQGSLAISKSHVKVIGMPLSSTHSVVRNNLSSRWVRSPGPVPFEIQRERLGLLFDNEIFQDFIAEARSCWVMGRWINAILDLAFAKSEVNEFRAKRNLPFSCIGKLWRIFSKFCPFLPYTSWDDFDNWANKVFSVYDLDFSTLPGAISEHATRASGGILKERWTKWGHWWKIVGPLNMDLKGIQTLMMKAFNGKSLFVSTEGDILFFKVKGMRETNKRENKPTFLVHFKDSAIVTVLQEFEWTWAAGQLNLCYGTLAESDLAQQARTVNLALLATASSQQITKGINQVVYIPREDILPASKSRDRETERGSRITNMTSYGSEDAFDSWWPSWFL